MMLTMVSLLSFIAGRIHHVIVGRLASSIPIGNGSHHLSNLVFMAGPKSEVGRGGFDNQ